MANGYYDLATPYAATKYTFNHLGSDRKLLDRVTMTYYEAGHMMYVHKPSLVKLKKDIASFMTPTPSFANASILLHAPRVFCQRTQGADPGLWALDLPLRNGSWPGRVGPDRGGRFSCGFAHSGQWSIKHWRSFHALYRLATPSYLGRGEE